MSGMHPDSGVPPAEARNSIPEATELSLNCDELWYSTSRCQPRFDPAAANAVLAELIHLINKGEVTYDCQYLDRVQLAVRYLIQRGLPTGTKLLAGPLDYTAALDPPLTRYNDYLTLIVVPGINNTGTVRINTDGRGLVPLLRNDAQPLQADDLRTNIPTLISYFGGYWWHVPMCASQVTKLQTGAVEGWVRTDGVDDPTHDGTQNTPQSAFRTLQYAYNRITERYFATATSSVILRLGITGRYAGVAVGPYAGVIVIQGDENNPGAYEIGPLVNAGLTSCCVQVKAAKLYVRGIALIGDMAANNWGNLRFQDAATVWTINCKMEIRSPVVGGFIIGETAGVWSTYGNNTFIGNGLTMNFAWEMSGAQCLGSNQPTPAGLIVQNCVFSQAGAVSTNLGYFSLPDCIVTQSGCTGPQYLVTDNSLMRAAGNTMPGNAPGIVQNNGLFFA